MAEQRAYLAGAGSPWWQAARSAGCSVVVRARVATAAIVAGVLACLLLLMATRTVVRNYVWSDPVRLWKEAAVNAPDIWLPHRGRRRFAIRATTPGGLSVSRGRRLRRRKQYPPGAR
jgi:hypothetical protein